MIELKKGQLGDMSTIIDIANTSFVPEREKGFDFRNIMPKAYGKGIDSSEQHVIVFEDGVPVACAGNFRFILTAGGHKYSASSFGTVSTLPQHRCRGYMTQMLNTMEKESWQRGDVFSVLTGRRARYERFGFEKFPSSYRFLFYPYNATDPQSDNLRISPATANDKNALYALYLKTQPIILRTEDTFFDALHTSDAKIFAIRNGEELVAYFGFSERKRIITELAVAELSQISAITSAIIRNTHGEVTFVVNALDRPLVSALDSIAEETQRVDDIHLLIRNMQSFLELLLAVNDVHAPAEIWKIGDETFDIAPNLHPTVTKTNKKPMFVCSVRDFIRHALGDGVAMGQSRIFPLYFGISVPDMY